MAPLRHLRRGHRRPSSWTAFPLLTAATLAVAAAVLTGTIIARQGLRGLRERQCTPGDRGVPRRSRRRELCTGPPHQPHRGERLRGLHAWTRLQHLSHRRGRSLPRSRAIPPAAACSSRSSSRLPRVPARCRMTRRPVRSAPTSCSAGWRVSPSPRPSGCTATSANPIGVEIAEHFGLKIDFGSWLAAPSVPTLAAILPSARAVPAASPWRARDTRRDHRRPRSPAVAGTPGSRRKDRRGGLCPHGDGLVSWRGR